MNSVKLHSRKIANGGLGPKSIGGAELQKDKFCLVSPFSTQKRLNLIFGEFGHSYDVMRPNSKVGHFSSQSIHYGFLTKVGKGGVKNILSKMEPLYFV